MQGLHSITSGFVDNPVISPPQDPAIWLLLWERYNYGQIGVVMGDRKERGLGVGKIAIFAQTHFG